MIRKGNFESIRERVVAAQKIDTVLEVVFGMGLETTEAKAIEALNYYIDGLRKAITGDLLISEKELGSNCFLDRFLLGRFRKEDDLH